MKKTALQICSTIGLAVLILMAVVSAQAQTRYRVHIPFDFTIGQNSYEAGDYFIDPLSPHTANNTFGIRDTKGRSSQILIRTPGEDYSRVEKPTLVFNRYDTQYFLAEVRTPSFIVKLSKSKAQERLARIAKAEPKIVALVKNN